MATPRESKSIMSLHMLDDECFTDALGQLSMEPGNPWNEKMHAMLNNSCLISKNLGQYIRSIKLQLNVTKIKTEWEQLSSMILSHLLIIKIKVYEQNINLNSATARLLEDILSIYGMVELKIAAIMYKDEVFELSSNQNHQLGMHSKQILSKLKHTFHWTELSIAHCLLKLKFDRQVPACVEIMKKMYYDILFEHRITHFNDMTLCAYYLLFCKYKRITGPENHSEMQQQLLDRFHKKSGYLNNLPILRDVVERKSSKGRLQIVNNYFKYINEKEKALDADSEAADDESNCDSVNTDYFKSTECFWQSQPRNANECSKDERIITFMDSTQADIIDCEENSETKDDEKTVYYLESIEEIIEENATTDGNADKEDITIPTNPNNDGDASVTEVTEVRQESDYVSAECENNEDGTKTNLINQLQEYLSIEKVKNTPNAIETSVEELQVHEQDQINYLFEVGYETPRKDRRFDPHLIVVPPQGLTDAENICKNGFLTPEDEIVCNLQNQEQSLQNAQVLEGYTARDVETLKLRTEQCNNTSTFNAVSTPLQLSNTQHVENNCELRRKSNHHKAITSNQLVGLQEYHCNKKLIEQLIMPSFIDEDLLKSHQISSSSLRLKQYKKQLLSSLDMDINSAFVQLNRKPNAIHCGGLQLPDPKLFKMKPVVDLSQFMPSIFDNEIKMKTPEDSESGADILNANHNNNYTDSEINLLLEAVKFGTEMRLPFKKRRMTVPEENTTGTDISYPATTMVSIAELEAIQPAHCGRSFVPEPPPAPYDFMSCVSSYYEMNSSQSIQYCADAFNTKVNFDIDPHYYHREPIES